MTVGKPKPKQLLRPITTGANSAMNQSQFLAITCNLLKAREKSRVHRAIGFGFASPRETLGVSPVNEKRLFLGTILKGREGHMYTELWLALAEKNAAVYGEGSYFALIGSYSNAYPREDANPCQFIFLAKVLVGSYTGGHSKYRLKTITKATFNPS